MTAGEESATTHRRLANRQTNVSAMYLVDCYKYMNVFQDDIRTRGDSRPFVPPDHLNLSPMEEDEDEEESKMASFL